MSSSGESTFSLSRRLVFYLLIGQLVVYFVIWVINVPLSLTGLRVDLDLIANELAENRARASVSESLRLGPDGLPVIEPTAALLRQMSDNPKLRFAVFDIQLERAAPGSSPELVAEIRKLEGVRPYFMNFRLGNGQQDELRGALTKADTSVGRVIIVTYGYILRWSDLFYFIYDNARDNFIYFVPVAIAAALIAAFAVRQGMAPLRAAAASAKRIDMNSIDQRIPLNGIPDETRPLVDAINAALARLDAGASRQRRFAANAAHEMRTPVAILRTRVDMMDDAAPQKAELRRDARRLQNIVEQLLISARLGEQSAPMDESVDLVEAVRALVGDYAPLVIENKRHIEFESPLKSLTVKGNRRALDCIVANLLDNALRAEPVGGCVLVSVETGARIRVEDHGAGVARADREMIFEPFWRGSEGGSGTGLGLAVVRELADLHHGVVKVTETPGGGATFEVTIPQA